MLKPELPIEFVDPINLQWATMHGRLGALEERSLGGAESEAEGAAALPLGLLASTSTISIRKTNLETDFETIGHRGRVLRD